MLKRKPARPQRDPAVILRDAVLLIPHKRQTSSGELGPDLMGAAGMKPDADTGHILCPVQYPIFQNRFLDILSRLRHNIGLPLLLIAQQQILEFSVIIL